MILGDGEREATPEELEETGVRQEYGQNSTDRQFVLYRVKGEEKIIRKHLAPDEVRPEHGADDVIPPSSDVWAYGGKGRRG